MPILNCTHRKFSMTESCSSTTMALLTPTWFERSTASSLHQAARSVFCTDPTLSLRDLLNEDTHRFRQQMLWKGYLGTMGGPSTPSGGPLKMSAEPGS